MLPAKYILACDVGGTRIKLGVARGARLLARMQLDARPENGLAAALKRIARETPALCRQAGVRQKSLAGFGLAFPGVIAPRREKILSAPAGKFDDAKNLDVAALTAKILGLPARLCNDANAALAAEQHFGAARGFRSVVMMTLGTGIGASAIIDGVPLRGQHGQAGCLGGHLTANLDGTICRCGNIGCAETEASTWALPPQARAHPKFSGSSLSREQNLDYAAVFRAAAQGDPPAVALRDRALRVWSVALVNLIHAYDPEIAVIGGGIMRSGKIILPALRRHAARHAWTPWGRVKIKAAALGNDAGMLGAASLFLDEQ
jgi:glucokinase